MRENEHLNKKQLAGRLGISRRGVEEMMRRRKIPFLELGHRTVRFHWPSVEKAIGKLEHKAIGQEGR